MLQLPNVFKEDEFITYGKLCFDFSKNDYKLIMSSYSNSASLEFGGKFVLVASLKDKDGGKSNFLMIFSV